ncbi:OVARIAN TUMOR DOMAIN-containing deubiquitinating enzyme 9-like protein [Drosera capensis]
MKQVNIYAIMNDMTVYETDPDVARWGLNQLCARPSGNSGRHSVVTRFDVDVSQHGDVQEGYAEPVSPIVENDAVIARALQEELSALAAREARGYSDLGEKQLQASISAQDWVRPQKIDETPTINDDSVKFQQTADESEESATSGSPGTSHQAPPRPPEEFDENALGDEVEKRLDQMVPIPHVPKINGDIPSENDAESDHQRLLDRLKVYQLVEMKVKGDGNCQFRSLSDQIYRTSEHHGYVRQVVVDQLKSDPKMYEGYVPMAYGEYLKKMSKSGEWGDHVTLQAASDTYGIKIFVLTSFRDTCYIEILPKVQKSNRELPVPEPKKTLWKLFGL